jgi:nitroimidazol reductase NimA-like FMN-containing flavoprotein (pyridoxamine 5'-phosphate oxidase superfamily)
LDTIIPTERTKLVRYRERGTYDRETVNAIIDEALICHVGFAVDGQPFVIPTTHARIGDKLYLHGSVANRMLRSVKAGAPVCVTMTLIDGLVLARSAMHHSMNYRSVMILGAAHLVADENEKRRALEALVNHVVPGRAAEVRAPNTKELKATSVLCLPITEVSAKIRKGPPVDDEEDYALDMWAGVLPLQLRPGTPKNDPKLAPGTLVPPGVVAYGRGRSTDID